MIDGERGGWVRVPSSSVFGCDRLNIINILRQTGKGKGKGGKNMGRHMGIDELSVAKMDGNREKEKRT